MREQTALDDALESVACAIMLAALGIGAIVGIAIAHLARWGSGL